MSQDKKKRTYQSTALGVPPLKMVLVHARNEAQNAATLPAAVFPPTPAEDEQPLDKEQAVRKIIRHLQAGEH
jgi:hypothetical protein